MEATQRPAVARASVVTRAFAWLVVRLSVLIVPAWIAGVVLATIALPGLGQGGALGGIEPAGTRAAGVEQRSAQLFASPLVARALVVQHDPRGPTRAAQQAALRRAGRVRDPALPDLAGVVPILNRTTAVSYLFFDPAASLDDQAETAHAYAKRVADGPGDALFGVTGTSPGRVAQWEEISDALPWVTIATVGLIVLVVGLRFRLLEPRSSRSRAPGSPT